ncbi:hypothetical protein K1719_044390 [Acacia pycnantha]|nr:hypothetical protein K1719_044390 [Acacia pycnantha]
MAISRGATLFIVFPTESCDLLALSFTPFSILDFDCLLPPFPTDSLDRIITQLFTVRPFASKDQLESGFCLNCAWSLWVIDLAWIGPKSQNVEVKVWLVPWIEGLVTISSEDVCGLLKAAIRDPDPVVFLENEFLYGESFPVSNEVLDSSFCLPISKAKHISFLPRCFVFTAIQITGSRALKRRENANWNYRMRQLR